MVCAAAACGGALGERGAERLSMEGAACEREQEFVAPACGELLLREQKPARASTWSKEALTCW